MELRRHVSMSLLVSLLITALLALAGSTAAAAAHDEDKPGNLVTGQLKDTSNNGAPVEGVTIEVTGPDGQGYTATSDAEGVWEVFVPGDSGGRFTVTIDESSLPEGASMREGRPTTLTPTALPNQTLRINFDIGVDTRDVATKWDQVPEKLYSGLLFGLMLALGALGLNMIFGTTGLTNFAHGELITFGAMATYMFNAVFGWNFAMAGLMAVALAALFGWLQETALWRPLRHRGTGLIAMMIVSIGFQFLLRNLFQYFTEGRTESYADHTTPAGHDFNGWFTYSYRDLVLAGIAILVLVGVTAGLSFTRLGRATRAVADNPALAAATGIDVDRVIKLVWIVGTALAGLCGVFLGFSLQVTFQIGQLTLLLLFAAVCVGGLGSVWGALIGSLLIGLLIEMSTLVIASDLKNAGAMLLLIVVLLIRPQGLLGRKERIG